MDKIKVKNLSVEYIEKQKKFKALENIEFSIQEGEFVSIIGPSGCGKSTLLRVLEGLLKPTVGEAFIDNKKIEGPGLNRGIVFQNYSLFPWMSAEENVAFGIKHTKKELSKSERLKLAGEYLKKVGLEKFKDKYPLKLSGGQQQRVAIARAAAMDTEILLMDEPFGAIDPKNRAALQELILNLWENTKDKKKTVVFVTHDIDEAVLLSDKIIVMGADPGHIKAELKVEFERPRNRALLIHTQKYINFRNTLTSFFYDNVTEKTDIEKENEILSQTELSADLDRKEQVL